MTSSAMSSLLHALRQRPVTVFAKAVSQRSLHQFKNGGAARFSLAHQAGMIEAAKPLDVSKTVIRMARASDMDEVRCFIEKMDASHSENGSSSSSLTTEDFTSALNSGLMQVIVADMSGSLTALLLFNEGVRASSFFTNALGVFVEPEFRNTGLGLGLARLLARWAVSVGHERVEMAFQETKEGRRVNWLSGLGFKNATAEDHVRVFACEEVERLQELHFDLPDRHRLVTETVGNVNGHAAKSWSLESGSGQVRVNSYMGFGVWKGAALHLDVDVAGGSNFAPPAVAALLSAVLKAAFPQPQVVWARATPAVSRGLHLEQLGFLDKSTLSNCLVCALDGEAVRMLAQRSGGDAFRGLTRL